MADTPDPEAPSKTKWLIAGAVIVVAMLVYFAVRTPAKDGANAETSASSSSGSSASSSSTTSSGSSGSHANNGTTSGAPHEGTSGGGGGGGNGAAGSASVGAITSGNPVDVTQLLLEAKTVEAARTALAAGDPRKALKELEFYDKIPNAQSLRQEATLLKIEAMQLVGRKTEARALAMSTRDDPSFNTYQGRINDLLFPQDSGK